MTYEEIRGHLADIYGISISKDFITTVTDAVLRCQIVAEPAVGPVLPDRVGRRSGRQDPHRRGGEEPSRLSGVGTQRRGPQRGSGLMDRERRRVGEVLAEDFQRHQKPGRRHHLCGVLRRSDRPARSNRAVYGDAWIQTCVVHLIRNSLKHVSWKDRRAVAKDLKPIYQAATEDAAASELEAFDEIWAGKYPMIGESWRARWELFTPFLAFPEPIRRMPTPPTRSKR